jgi:choline dehydrogenase
MKPFVKREILPGDRKGEALDNLIRDGAMSMHHPTCTAKMGRTTSRSWTRNCGSMV